MSKVTKITKAQKKTDSGNEGGNDNPMKANAVTPIKKPKNKLPLGYKLEADGIYWLDPNQDEPSPLWLCSPLQVVAMTCDLDNQNWGRIIEFCDPKGVCKSWTMPMELLTAGSSEGVYKVLQNMGVIVSTKIQARYKLSELLGRQTDLPVVTCTTRIGWHGNDYVLPFKTFAPLKPDVVYQTDKIDALGFSESGTLEEWQQHIARFAEHSTRVRLAISASFAAPMLTALHMEGGGFHIRGRSSKGKTISLFAAMSVWGSHERKLTWRTTDNALELTAYQHNDSLLTIDEVGETTAETLGNAAYMLANGQGKNRANQSKPHRWNLLFLSTGEIDMKAALAAAGIIVKAGQEVRMINIEAVVNPVYGIFETIDTALFKDSGEQAKYIEKKTNLYYGTAGKAYLEAITKDKAAAVEFMNQAMTEFIQAVELPENADSQIKRVLNRFAIVAAGGELATHHGITGWNQGDATQGVKKCFYDWLDTKGNIEQSHEHMEAIERVKSFVEKHGSTRFEDYTQRKEAIYQSEPAPSRDRLGIKFTKDGKTVYLFYPTQFRDEVCKGLSQKLVIEALRVNGVLIAPSGRVQLQSPRLKDGERFRGYGVSVDILEK